MTYFEGIVLGIIQGLSEFLPISSSGHVLVVPAIFGWDDPGASFSAIIQLGTLCAVLLYFRRELVRIFASTFTACVRHDINMFRKNADVKMGVYLLVATIPIVIAGLLGERFITTIVRNVYLVASCLLIFGILLYVIDRVAPQQKAEKDISLFASAVAGIAQAFALLPGTSRSGVTLTAIRFLGFERKTAARFTFLLSFPSVLLSGVYKLKDLSNENDVSWSVMLLSTFVAFIFGYIAIAWFISWLSHHSTFIFFIYRVILAITLFTILGFGIITST